MHNVNIIILKDRVFIHTFVLIIINMHCIFYNNETRQEIKRLSNTKILINYVACKYI